MKRVPHPSGAWWKDTPVCPYCGITMETVYCDGSLDCEFKCPKCGLVVWD